MAKAMGDYSFRQGVLSNTVRLSRTILQKGLQGYSRSGGFSARVKLPMTTQPNIPKPR